MKSIPFCCIIMTLGLILSPLSSKTIPTNDQRIHYSGRVEFSKKGHALLGYSGTRICLSFIGSELSCKMRTDGNDNWINVFIDGQRVDKIKIQSSWETYSIAKNLTPTEHTIQLIKATEGFEGKIEIAEIELPDESNLLPTTFSNNIKIEFIGDSITCGYGIETNNPDESYLPSTENFCDSYAWHTINALDADYLVVSRSGIGMLRNYDGPQKGNKKNLPFLYEQSFFHYKNPKWDFQRFTPNVVCINLGTNDFSTTGVNVNAYENAYREFVEHLLQTYDEAKIVCLLGPMLNTPEAKSILQRVVKTTNSNLEKPRVFHFEMSAQGKLGYGADWHPSKEQALLNAKELTTYLKNLMNIRSF